MEDVLAFYRAPVVHEEGAVAASPVVVVDNDGCIGAWEDLSCLYALYTQVEGKVPSVESFVKLMVEAQCVRPHLRDLLDVLVRAREEGKVHAIVMCTAATGSTGWVAFLCSMVTAWYGSHVYDLVVDGDSIRLWHQARGTAVYDARGAFVFVKDMDQVRHLLRVPPRTRVLVVDDQPDKIVNGAAIAVSKYAVALQTREAVDYLAWVDDTLKVDPDVFVKYDRQLLRSWRRFGQFPSDFSDVRADRSLVMAKDQVLFGLL